MGWMNAFIQSNVIIQPCPNLNGGLANPPLKQGPAWIISSYCFIRMQLFIHVLDAGQFKHWFYQTTLDYKDKSQTYAQSASCAKLCLENC